MKFINLYSEYMLNETLKSIDINLSMDLIHYELSLMKYDFSLNNKNNKIIINLFNVDKNHIFASMLEALLVLMIDRLGWFSSTMEIINLSDNKNLLPFDKDYLLKNNKYIKQIEFTFEPKYDVETKLPKYLYHLTFGSYIDKIMKIGLVPKSKNKLSKHLDRIYVCSNKEDCIKLMPRMKALFNNKYIDDKWFIIEIDTSDLNILLYKDPNYESGYYVIDNIKPSSIKIIEKE